jgi:L-threonylcarbamoyladenylate synthase
MSKLRFSTVIGPDVAEAARWLLADECVGMPTETVYGLAANALKAETAVKIFSVKNRPSFDPLIVHVSGIAQAERYVTGIPAPLLALAERFWPGPLTLLLPKRDTIPDVVTSGLPRVALRVPAHPMAQALLNALPFPVAAPSANPFGYISPTTARHVADQLGGLIPYVLEGGACEVGVESTILGWDTAQQQVVLHRLGGLSVEIIEAVTGPVHWAISEGSNPAAPGMLDTHYAPRKPLYLGQFADYLPNLEGNKVGLLTLSWHPLGKKATHHIELSAKGDLNEAAQHLFDAMRWLDTADVDVIVAEPMPDVGLGRAINDRLKRASSASGE